jgi:hypothetical protein
MSFRNFKEAMKLLNEFKDKLDVISPKTTMDIQCAEEILSIKFPNSYKEFLKLYGCMGLGSEEIYGLWNNSVIQHTLHQREVNKTPTFPDGLIPIYELGNGEKSCLDTSQMNEEGECPVVAWYFGATEKLAEDFGAFLLEKVQWGLESLEEEKK